MIDVRRIEHADALVVMSERDRAALAAVLTPLRFASGQLLITQGHRSGAAYLLLSGTLNVRRSVGEDHVLQGGIPVGEWFGVLSVLDGHPATASVHALTDVEVAALGRADFDKLLWAGDGVGSRLLRAWLRSLGMQLGRVNRGNEAMLELASRLR